MNPYVVTCVLFTTSALLIYFTAIIVVSQHEDDASPPNFHLLKNWTNNVRDPQIRLTFGPWPWESIVPSKHSYLMQTANNTSPAHHRSKRQAKLPCRRGKRLNQYVDGLLRFGMKYLEANEPLMVLPNSTIDLPEYNILIYLYNGGVTRTYTAMRKKKAWVKCARGVESLGVTVMLKELRIFYNYRFIKDWKLLFDGDVEIQILRPVVQIQYSQAPIDPNDPNDAEKEMQQRVETVRLVSFGAIRVMIRGLGNLTQAVSMWLTGYINSNIDQIMYMYRERIEMALLVLFNEGLARRPLPIEQANRFVESFVDADY